jgi:hypothetical protein
VFDPAEAAMHLTLTPEETRLLVNHLAQRIEHMDAELVHTDRRDLQRSLANELQALRAPTERIRSSAASPEAERPPDGA